MLHTSTASELVISIVLLSHFLLSLVISGKVLLYEFLIFGINWMEIQNFLSVIINKSFLTIAITAVNQVMTSNVQDRALKRRQNGSSVSFEIYLDLGRGLIRISLKDETKSRVVTLCLGYQNRLSKIISALRLFCLGITIYYKYAISIV